MSSSQTIFKGIIIMFIGILMGIICNYGLLIPATTIEDGFCRAGVYDLDNPEWDTRADIDRLVIYLHVTVYLFPILGVLYFGISIIKVLRYSEESEYSEGQTQMYGKF